MGNQKEMFNNKEMQGELQEVRGRLKDRQTEISAILKSIMSAHYLIKETPKEIFEVAFRCGKAGLAQEKADLLAKIYAAGKEKYERLSRSLESLEEVKQEELSIRSQMKSRGLKVEEEQTDDEKLYEEI